MSDIAIKICVVRKNCPEGMKVSENYNSNVVSESRTKPEN